MIDFHSKMLTLIIHLLEDNNRPCQDIGRQREIVYSMAYLLKEAEGITEDELQCYSRIINQRLFYLARLESSTPSSPSYAVQ